MCQICVNDEVLVKQKQAESTGFEPVRVLRLKGLAIPRIGPLCQLSTVDNRQQLLVYSNTSLAILPGHHKVYIW